MKHTFIALLALCLCAGGCGKKETPKPQEQAKSPSKPALPVSEKDRIPRTPNKTPQPKPEPKVDPTKHERFLWEFKTGGVVFSSPAIGSDGTVYVGSDDNKLYAIKTESKGLAKSPWPMRGQNARHTGRVMKKK